MRKLEIPALLPLGLSVALFLSGGCATIAENYRIADNSSHTRGYTSIAGDIEVGRQAKIGGARTVAGDIEVREGGRTGSITTVAGRVRLAAGVKVEGSIKTVAGDVTIAPGCTVTGDVSTVAGHITMTDSVVEGNVTLANGKLEISGTRVAGEVRVRYKKSDDDERVAKVTIGPGTEVAALVVEDKAEVRLRIHRSAKVRSIKGAEPEYYD